MQGFLTKIFSNKNIKQWSLVAYFFVFLTVFLTSYSKIYDSKIDLNGDNAGYYILGKSIAQGEGFTNIHKKEMTPHNHFPVGYPLLIGGVIKFLDGDIETVKALNGVFLFFSLVIVFLIVAKLTHNYHIAFGVTIFLLFNRHLLQYSTIMMSEVPYMFFSLLSLWLFLKTNLNQKVKGNYWFFLLILLVSFTYHIRSTGLSLFAGILLYLIVKRKWSYVAVYFLSFVGLGSFWMFRTHQLGGSPYVRQLFMKNPYRASLGQMELLDWAKRIWTNFERYITREIPSGLFNFIAEHTPKEEIVIAEWIIGVVTTGLIILGVFQLKKRFVVIFYYLLATFGILMLWPSQWFGPRFMLPVIPLMFVLFVLGVVKLLSGVTRRISKRVSPRLAWVAMFILGAYLIKPYSEGVLMAMEIKSKNPYPSNFQNYFDLGEWVRENAPDSSLVACRKTQIFHLHSDKQVSNFLNSADTEEQIKFLKEKKVDYVIVDQLGYSSTGRYLYPAVKRYPTKFKVIKHLKDPDTYLLKFQPQFGYEGEFNEEGEREGLGEFKWETGIVYKGYWKTGVRNGRGMMSYPNGNVVEGNWVNDTLQGVASIRSTTQRIYERSIFKDNVRIKILERKRY